MMGVYLHEKDIAVDFVPEGNGALEVEFDFGGAPQLVDVGHHERPAARDRIAQLLHLILCCLALILHFFFPLYFFSDCCWRS